MIHKCNKEKEIENINEAIYGNGKDGLMVEVARLRVDIEKTIIPQLNEIKQDVRVLLHFQTQTQTKEEQVEKYKKEARTQRRWVIGLFFGVLVSLVGIILTYIKT